MCDINNTDITDCNVEAILLEVNNTSETVKHSATDFIYSSNENWQYFDV